MFREAKTWQHDGCIGSDEQRGRESCRRWGRVDKEELMKNKVLIPRQMVG